MKMLGTLLVFCLCMTVGCGTALDAIYRDTAATKRELVRFRSDYVQKTGELEAQVEGLKSAEQLHYDTMVARIAELDSRLSQLETDIAKISSLLEEIKFNRRTSASGMGSSPPAPDVIRAQAASEPPSLNQEQMQEGETIYTSALRQYNRGEYDAAINTFNIFLERYPNAPQAGNATYWLGECYYSLDKIEDALKSYEETVRRYPANQIAASALWRSAHLYEISGDKPKALETINRILINYPNFDQIERVKEKAREFGG